MKRLKRSVVFGMCIAWLLTLLGCGKEKPFMLDGPEMEYQSPWTAFTLSRSDSDPQYNFSFTVTDNGEQALVTGECNDENGNPCIKETGAEISAEDIWKLRWMDFDQLSEKMPTDKASITLTLSLTDGTTEEKNISEELSEEIYKLLLPYLKNN